MADRLPNVEGDAGRIDEAAPVTLFDPVDRQFANLVVHSAVQYAIRDGLAYIGPTGVQSVPTGEKLVLKIENPAGSGRDVHLINRLFSNDRGQNDENLEYEAFRNPTITLANTRTIGVSGSRSQTAGAVVTWESVAGATNIGGVPASGELLPNGRNYSRPLESLLLEGSSLAFVISGVGGQSVAAALRASITLEWYEVII